MKQKINKSPNDANMLLSVRFAGAVANEGLASSPRSLSGSKLTDNETGLGVSFGYLTLDLKSEQQKK